MWRLLLFFSLKKEKNTCCFGQQGSSHVSFVIFTNLLKYLVKEVYGSYLRFLPCDGTVSFNERSTFSIHQNAPFVGYTSFEGTGRNKNSFIRHLSKRLRLMPLVRQQSYDRERSFLMTSDRGFYYTFQSKNNPKHYWNVTSAQSSQVRIFPGQKGKFRILTPGLTGDGVSFYHPESGKYLRNKNSYILLEDIASQDGDPWESFHKDATFYIRDNKYFSGYQAFESNRPGYFIRHSSHRLRVQKEDSSTLFKNDASFVLNENYYL